MKKTGKYKSGYKKLFIIIFFIIITAPITISTVRSFIYVVTHGDEIESFEPYTLEQCRIDAAKN